MIAYASGAGLAFEPLATGMPSLPEAQVPLRRVQLGPIPLAKVSVKSGGVGVGWGVGVVIGVGTGVGVGVGLGGAGVPTGALVGSGVGGAGSTVGSGVGATACGLGDWDDGRAGSAGDAAAAGLALSWPGCPAGQLSEGIGQLRPPPANEGQWAFPLRSGLKKRLPARTATTSATGAEASSVLRRR
jgi:hypothetical protein